MSTDPSIAPPENDAERESPEGASAAEDASVPEDASPAAEDKSPAAETGEAASEVPAQETAPAESSAESPPADETAESGEASESGDAAEAAEGSDAAEGGDAAEAAKGGKRSKAEKPAKPKWKPPSPERLDGAVEAMLLVAGDVLKLDRLRDLLGLPSRGPLHESIERISARWQEAGLSVEVEQVAGGVRVVTRPEFAEYVGRLQRRPQSDKLTKSLLETLSIFAYKQPVGRAEVERIRGVQAGEALRGLLERNLLKVVGRSDQPGRPLLYGTTDRFLTLFGMNSLQDLPTDGDLKRL